MIRKAIRRKSIRDDLLLLEHTVSNTVTSIRRELFPDQAPPADFQMAKLNIGCGGIIREGWINLDMDPGPGAFYLNVMNGLPFKSGSARHIHCEHFLEHLEFDTAVDFLRECRRILIPGGVARVILPDCEKYVRAYCRGDRAFFENLNRLGGAQTPLDTPAKVMNQMFRMGGAHRFAWDFETLDGAVKEAGFFGAERSAHGQAPPEFCIDGEDQWRLIESLYANLLTERPE